jgi:membrane fusion protein (multidrug efflux system)
MVQIEANMLSAKAKVEAARAVVNDRVIRAPFGGRVGLRNVSVGGLVTPGQIITTLDDTSVIKLDFTVPETFLATVKVGQQVEAASAAYNGEIFRGRVSGISTRVDPDSRSVTMRALIDNRNGRLKPGMFMSVRLTRDAGKALLIPEQSLVPQGDAQYVFRLAGDVVTKQAVIIGRRKPGHVEVTKGLSPGDLIVIEGGEKLQDGAKVNVVNDKAQDAVAATTPRAGI